MGSKPKTQSGVQHAKQEATQPPRSEKYKKYDDKHNPDYDDRRLNEDGSGR